MGSLATRSAIAVSALVLASVGHADVALGQSQTGLAPAQPTPPPPEPAPPAWNDLASTSLAGTQLVPASNASPTDGAGTDSKSAAAAVASSTEDLERRVDSLETRLDAANARLKDYAGELRWLRMFEVSGYVQPQLLWQWFNAAASPNATNGVLPPGVSADAVIANPATASTPTTNQDYFRLRRARLKVEFLPIDSARFVFEIDPTAAGGQVGGTGTIAREIEAEGIAHWTDHVTTEFGAGIFKIPFGFEVLQNDADRPFIERSWGERNMTPGEFDTGARAYTTFDARLTFQVALINGNMEGEKTFSVLPDLNKGKDLVGRLNYDFGPFDAGISGYYGEGQLVNAATLQFKQYARGAGNLELALHHVFADALGATRVFAEGTIATNMDRGVNYGPGIGLPALPANVATENVTSLHEWSAWGRLEQDFTGWFTLGLRLDYYTPDDSQAKNGRTTYAAVGAVHFTRWLQYMIEFDHSIDNVRPVGAPGPSKLIDMLSNVLQARF
jgi:hypothetical protein